MRPTVTEQLHGLRQVLADVVAPHVDDPYPADVLAGALATLELLAEAWTEVPAFLRWDAAETAAVLDRVAVITPPAPADPLDLIALHAHADVVRGLLESHMHTVLADPAARAAAVAHVRARADRYPLATRPPGAPRADTAR